MRPSAQNLNRAGRGSSSDRATAAPGLNVQAPINVNTGPSQLEGLAQVLGVGANLALNDAQRARRIRQLEEEKTERLVSISQAESDARNGNFDPDRARQDSVYARRHRIYAANRVAREKSEQLLSDLEAFRRENPLADEVEVRAFQAQWREAHMIDAEGNPLVDPEDPVTESIVGSALDDIGFKFLERDRDTLRQNLQDATVEDIEGAVLSAVRTTGMISEGSYQSTYTSLRNAGLTTEQANARVAQIALSAAEITDSEVPLQVIPDQWENGDETPLGNPEIAQQLDRSGDVYAARRAAAEMKALEPKRLEFRLMAERKAARGIDLTSKEREYGLSIGMTAAGLAGYAGSAETSRERARRAAEREAREAQRHAQLMARLADNPYSVDRSKAEDGWTKEYLEAAPEEQGDVVRAAITQRGVLPGIVRNRLNRVPINPNDMGSWVAGIQQVKSLDPQVYASLDQNARSAFEAYEALRASGAYSDRQAFERLQVRSDEAARSFINSDEGEDLLADMVGDDPTPYALSQAERTIRNFASFSDLPRSEIETLARESFETTFFTHDGNAYNRSAVKDADAIEEMKELFATELSKKGTRVSADDLVVAPLGDGSQFTIRERNGIAPLTPAFNVDVIKRKQRADALDRIRVKYGDAAFGAAQQFVAGNEALRPERRIEGETNRLLRMSREREAIKALRNLEE